MDILLALGISYVLGSIPFGLIVGRMARGVDVRELGSHSSGATNVVRTLGKKYGLIVFLLDIAKGMLSVFVAQRLTDNPWVWAAAALIAVVGHIFPIFAGFKGGRGVATGVGGVLMMVPWAVLAGLIVWIIIFYTTRYVSLASILAAVMVMASAGVLFAVDRINLAALVYCVVAATVVIIAHRANIDRLRSGTENRFEAK